MKVHLRGGVMMWDQLVQCPSKVRQGDLRHCHCPCSPDPHQPQDQPVSCGNASVQHLIGQHALEQDARNKWDVGGTEIDRDKKREDAVWIIGKGLRHHIRDDQVRVLFYVNDQLALQYPAYYSASSERNQSVETKYKKHKLLYFYSYL